MNNYTVGDTVGLPSSFKNAGVAYDPDVIVCRVEQPSGEISDVSGTIVKLAVGSYQAQFTVVQLGQHTYEWEASTGSVAGVFKARFNVNDEPF